MIAGLEQAGLHQRPTASACCAAGPTTRSPLVGSHPLDRAQRIVVAATDVDAATAAALLDAADGNPKTAIVMQLAGVDVAAARILLDHANGFVRAAVDGPGATSMP